MNAKILSEIPPSWTREEVARFQAEHPAKVKATPKSPMEFMMLPLRVIKTLAHSSPALAVVAAIIKAHYDDIEHRNPVQLTSARLAEFGVSKDQKWRALKILEKAGLVCVDRHAGRNPLVTVKWKLRTKD